MMRAKHAVITVVAIIAIISLLFARRTAFSQSSQIADGITYLKMTQNANGSWGATPTSLNGVFPTNDMTTLAGDLVENRFDMLLGQIKGVLEREEVGTKAAPEQGFAGIERLAALQEMLTVEHQQNLQYFNRLEGLLEKRGLPAEIGRRHAEFVRDYQSRFETLTTHLGSIESAHKSATGFWGTLARDSQGTNRQQAIERTLAFLAANTPRPRTFDPRNLPHRSVRAERPIAPKLTHEEWLKAFPQEASGSSPESAKAPGAMGGNSTSPLATTPPTPADLAETIEVKFAPEIRQLADSLNRNPVKIYNWVRNNIEFVPTWGSIQGAQLCLESRTCNAFDTSSLLIALLRVSGIPARYQMGTIEVPIERFKNWAGGFTNAEAAASLFASGGVPSVVRRVNESGQVVTVRLEHSWVKAFVDYAPSGGAVNRQGNTWVELDAGFKQYDIHAALQDLTAVVPFNRDAYLSSSTTESPVSFYRQALADYVRQNFPGRTLNDFLTTRTVRSTEPPVLGGGLPYRTLIRGVSFADLPQTLRQQIEIQVARGGAQTVFTATLPEMLSKRLTLSFVPASAADVSAATGFEGLYLTPPYLLSVRPVFRLDGALVAQGAPVGMGQTLDMTFDLTLANGASRTFHNEVVAGSYITFFLAQHFVSDRLGERVAREFRRADDRFGTLNVDNSDRDPWIGGGLQGLGGYYFNRLDASNAALTEIFPVGQVKTAFAAYTSSDVEVSSLFGAPGGAQLTGMSIDADLLEDFAAARGGQTGAVTAFEMLRGLESSFWEHAIFEAAGVDPEHPGISTVKALQRAKTSGIQVFEVNAGNLGSIEPQLQVAAEVREAVRDGVNAGLRVIIPATNVQFGRWRGTGYIVEDPQTGAGAYQISGGLSGGTLKLEQPGLRGGTLPPEQPLWPSAVLAVGTPLTLSLMSVIDQMLSNSASVYTGIGQALHQEGYNVYVNEVLAETIVDFVNNSGPRTRNDVFFYVGHGGDGNLALPARDSGFRFIGPGQLGGRHFRIALLSACATGGDCPNDFLEAVVSGCTPNVAYQEAWEAALLGPNIGSTRHGQALVGSTEIIRAFQTAPGNRLFWATMTSGGSVGTAESFIEDSYLRGDPTTTLRGFGR